MEMHAIRSSNLAAIGYEPRSKTLAIQFRAGTIYHYAGVSPEVYAGLRGAKSPGGYFAAHVRPVYRGVKQEER